MEILLLTTFRSSHPLLDLSNISAIPDLRRTLNLPRRRGVSHLRMRLELLVYMDLCTAMWETLEQIEDLHRRSLLAQMFGSFRTLPSLQYGQFFEEDPYQHIECLGSGAYGYVDTVTKTVNPGAVFASKTIKITTGRNRDVQLKAVESEFEILRKLRHHHIIKVLEIYSCKNKLSIIMGLVAECDMKEYLEKLDGLNIGLERHSMLKPLLRWQGCLI